MSKSDTLKVAPSPQDDRDWIWQTMGNFPPTLSLDYRSELLPVRNQGTQSSCFAFAAACMKEWQEKQDYGLEEYLSPQFLYNNRFNLYDYDYTNDEGMYSRNVMKLLLKIFLSVIFMEKIKEIF